MSKYAILTGLGDYYKDHSSLGYKSLPFVYKNIHDFQFQLNSWSWIVFPPLLNVFATKENIINKINEAISNLSKGDTLLFYFTGHGDRFYNRALDQNQTFLVTALTEVVLSDVVDFALFLNDINYTEIIESFREKEAHLVTIVDCCYAMGMIDGYNEQRDYHTVIAASSENSKSFYDTNSLFFRALSKSWASDTFLHMKTKIERTMLELEAPNRSKIFIASNFENDSLKPI